MKERSRGYIQKIQKEGAECKLQVWKANQMTVRQIGVVGYKNALKIEEIIGAHGPLP